MPAPTPQTSPPPSPAQSAPPVAPEVTPAGPQPAPVVVAVTPATAVTPQPANAPAPATPQAATSIGAPNAPNPQGASFALNVPSAPLTAGQSFQVPVILNGGADVSAVAMQIRYDATKLMLVNLAAGDLLTRDGQAAPPIHTDQPVGNLTVGESRPPGTHGVSGTGVVCVLTFQAEAAGPSDLNITRASVVNSAQQQMQVASAQASVVVK
jgi:general secretion pathway protein D